MANAWGKVVVLGLVALSGCVRGSRQQVPSPPPVLPTLTIPSARPEADHLMPSVMHVCGRLRTVERGKIVLVPGASLALFEAKGQTACCKDLILIARRVSSEDGDFDFGTLKSGPYWLALDWGGGQPAAPIYVDAHDDWAGCEFQGPLLDGQNLNWVKLMEGTAD